MANYVNFEQLKSLFQEIGHKFKRVASAYVTKGNITFAGLPAPTANTVGFVYNVTNEFTTTADFVEGVGKKYSAGTNVAIVDVTPITYTVAKAAGDSAEYGANPKTLGWYEKDATQDVYFLTSDITADNSKAYYTAEVGTAAYKYDVIGNFVDVDGITARIEALVRDLAEEFDNTKNYSIGDIVIYNDVVYKFKAAHAADEWDTTKVDAITLGELIETSGEKIEELVARINNIITNFAPEFDPEATYRRNDLVTYNDTLYRCTISPDIAIGNTAWTAANWTTVDLTWFKDTIFSLKKFYKNIALYFGGLDPDETGASTMNYVPGDLVFYDPNNTGEKFLYVCKIPHSVTSDSDWDATKFQNISGISPLGATQPGLSGIIQNIKYSFAPPFAETESYKAGDYVWLDTRLYRFTSNWWSGTDTMDYTSPTTTGKLEEAYGGLSSSRLGALKELMAKANGNLVQQSDNNYNAAPYFTEASTSYVGAYYFYNNELYKCTTRHNGTWDASHFQRVTIIGLIKDLQNQIDSIESRLERLERTFDYKTEVTFEELPKTNLSHIIGQVFTVTDAFTTTDIFIEGLGVDYPANTKVMVVGGKTTLAEYTTSTGDNPNNLRLFEKVNGTYVPTIDRTVDSNKTYYTYQTMVQQINPNNDLTDEGKYIVLGTDLTKTTRKIDDITQVIGRYPIGASAAYFDDTTTYQPGDIVLSYSPQQNLSIWECTATHTGAWDNAHFKITDIMEQLSAAKTSEPQSLTEAQINELIGLL